MIAKFLIGLIFQFIFASLTLGDTEEQELDKRQADASRIINDLGAIESAAGYHRTALETYFYGEKGIKKSAEEFIKSSYALTQKFVQATGALEFKDQDSLGYVLETLEELFRSQAQQISKLQADLEYMKKSSSRLAALRKRSLGHPMPVKQDFKNLDATVRSSAETASKASEQIISALEQRLSSLQDLSKKGKDLIIAKLRARLITLGLENLEKSIEGANATLSYEANVRPLLLDLENAELEIERHVADLSFYVVEEKSAGLKKKCDGFEKSIEPFSLSDELQKKAAHHKQKICDAGLAAAKEFAGSFGSSPAAAIWEFAKTKEVYLAKKCKEKTNEVNCEKLAVLRSITKDRVEKMKPENLKFFERSWHEVTYL